MNDRDRERYGAILELSLRALTTIMTSVAFGIGFAFRVRSLEIAGLAIFIVFVLMLHGALESYRKTFKKWEE